MSSVYTVLTRFDRPVDGVTPSAEDTALTALEADATPDLVQMLHNLGGSYFLNADGLVEIGLNQRALRLDGLRRWMQVQLYRTADDVPQAFWEDVYTTWLQQQAPRRPRRLSRPCRECREQEATESFAGRPQVLCRDCAPIVRAETVHLEGQVMSHGACRRCGCDVTNTAVARQVHDFGRALNLCVSCYSSRSVTVTSDGVPSW